MALSSATRILLDDSISVSSRRIGRCEELEHCGVEEVRVLPQRVVARNGVPVTHAKGNRYVINLVLILL